MTSYPRILATFAIISTLGITAHAQTTTFPGNVVLSTNTPSVLLQDTAGGGKTYSLSSRWGGYFTIFDEADPGGQARFSINPNGTVGIGMTVPGFKLDVKNDNYNAIRATGNSSNSIGIYVQNTVSSGRQWGLLSSGGGPAPVGSFGIWDDAAGLRFTINDSGNVGIGTANPMNRMVVSSGPSARTQITLSDTNTASLMLRAGNGLPGIVASDVDLQLKAGAPWTDADAGGVTGLTIKTGSGNVGIGTTNPTHKLAVNGTIKAKEIIVETTGWSDYVFADDYALAPLTEVETHIKANKHLPGIPSATEVAEQGVSLGDMQARLLAKIEELTLYQIAQEKRANQQAALATEQTKEISSLRAQIAELKTIHP